MLKILLRQNAMNGDGMAASGPHRDPATWTVRRMPRRMPRRRANLLVYICPAHIARTGILPPPGFAPVYTLPRCAPPLDHMMMDLVREGILPAAELRRAVPPRHADRGAAGLPDRLSSAGGLRQRHARTGAVPVQG